MYSQAIAGAAQDHTLFSNRSAAYLALGLYEQVQRSQNVHNAAADALYWGTQCLQRWGLLSCAWQQVGSITADLHLGPSAPQALWDAHKAVALAPEWAKGYYRQGCAHLALSQWGPAVQALERGAELEPSNADMVRCARRGLCCHQQWGLCVA